MSRCIAALALADHRRGRTSRRTGARIERHLAGCAACRTVLARVAGAQAALAEVAATPDPATMPASAARLEATLRWTASHSLPAVKPAAARPRQLFVLASLAAAMVGVAIFWHGRHRATPAASASSLAARSPATPPPPVAARSSGGAIVTLVGGEARLRRGGREGRLDPRQPLLPGDTLVTPAGSRVAFQWGEGSGALLGPASELVLEGLAARRQELALERGRVTVRVGPHQLGEALAVTTRHHTVSVHGTWFVVAAEARATTVDVLEGVVEVGAKSGDGASLLLAAPTQARFPAGSAVPEARRSLSSRAAGALRQDGEMGLLSLAQVDLERAAGLDGLLGASGLLTVASDPPAAVAIDGVAFGAGPLALRRLHGRHFVELSRAGYVTWNRWITVGPEPGELRAALRPEATRPGASRSEQVPPGTDEVREVARARQRQIEACYEHALKRDPRLAGTVTLALRLGAAGQVLGTHVEDDTLGDAAVASCLRREAAGWAFARARNVIVLYPFVFRTP